QVAGVQPGQTGDADPVAHAVQPVAGEAGVARPALAAAEGDDLAVGRKRRAGAVADRRAAAEEGEDQQEEKGRHAEATTYELGGTGRNRDAWQGFDPRKGQEGWADRGTG